MIRARIRREPAHGDDGRDDGESVEIHTAELSGVFAAPSWLRDVGLTSWLLVGVTLLLVGSVWLFSLLSTIVMPVLTASVVAAVAAPLVARLQRRGLPRAAGAALVLLGAVVVGVAIVVAIVGGITGEASSLKGFLADAKTTIQGWLTDLGVTSSTAKDATDNASSTMTDAVDALLTGLGTGLSALSSLAFFLALTALSLFFLLKDGPLIRGWAERHAGVPLPVAHVIASRVLESLRGYFLGVTIVAGFNAVVVGLGALIFGVPKLGTILLVTFLGAYIPYLGAWSAGAFTVLVALGGAGTEAALGMTVVQLLANGALQQIVQPFAMGTALGIHPLAVLIVTIGGGALFGGVGLILAAPLTSAAVKIAADLARARAADEARTAAPEHAPDTVSPAI
jgi:predicted PurR-regulated permease PerM